ncbi:MAG: hypothetical protein JW829_04410 [Pirellulales bacterium]|nr:hypothetical protein [Pirellulales bacterium]
MLANIEKHYGGRQSPADAEKTVFQGNFTDTIPNDLNGAGTFVHYASALGDTYSYVERFQGSDEIQKLLTKRQKAVSKLVDILLDWFDYELSKEPNYPQLHNFINHRFRQDMINLGLLLWTAEAIGYDLKDVQAEMCARIWQYLREHEYLSTTDILALIRSFTTQDSLPVLKHLQRLAARRLDS